MQRTAVQQAIKGIAVGVAVGLGLSAWPAHAQFSDYQVGVLVDALQTADPKTDAKSYTAWQRENIPRWAEKCLGRSLSIDLFIASPVTARAVTVCTLRDVLNAEISNQPSRNPSVAIRRTAAYWRTGDPNLYANKDNAAFTQTVLSLYQQKQPPVAAVPPRPAATTSPPPAIKPPGATTSATAASTTPTSTTATTPAATPASASRATVYDRYMQAGYRATQGKDRTTALLYFRRALDERPEDPYALRALRNVETYLPAAQASAAPPSTSLSTAPVPGGFGASPSLPPREIATPRSAPAPGVSPAPAASLPVSAVAATPRPLAAPRRSPGVVNPTAAKSPAKSPSTAPPAPTATVDVAAQPIQFTQEQAVALVNRWLEAKSDIFAPPFDQQQVLSLTTGELMASLLKPDGVLSWLKSNRAYYRYGVQKVDSVTRFATNRDRATIEVQITEDRTLYVNGAIAPERTAFAAQQLRFTLESADGTWRIADYKTVDGSLMERSTLP
jgi:hypothetical protein